VPAGEGTLGSAMMRCAILGHKERRESGQKTRKASVGSVQAAYVTKFSEPSRLTHVILSPIRAIYDAADLSQRELIWVA
jgi:hypothetical protein